MYVRKLLPFARQRTYTDFPETPTEEQSLMRFLLWFVAFAAALIALVASAFVGQTPVTEGLFGLALVAGFLGFLADRMVTR